MTKNQNVSGSGGVQKDTLTAGPSKAAAAEQSEKGKELAAERLLKTEQLLAERTLKVKQLEADSVKDKAVVSKLQAKVKDLLEAVRYRDRKIRNLGLGTAPVARKVIGSNVMDHSRLGEAEGTVIVPTQAKAATKQAVRKGAVSKH